MNKLIIITILLIACFSVKGQNQSSIHSNDSSTIIIPNFTIFWTDESFGFQPFVDFMLIHREDTIHNIQPCFDGVIKFRGIIKGKYKLYISFRATLSHKSEYFLVTIQSPIALEVLGTDIKLNTSDEKWILETGFSGIIPIKYQEPIR